LQRDRERATDIQWTLNSWFLDVFGSTSNIIHRMERESRRQSWAREEKAEEEEGDHAECVLQSTSNSFRPINVLLAG